MAPKKKRKTKTSTQKKRSSAKFYTWGILFLLTILAGGIFLNDNPLDQRVSELIYNKKQIAEHLGSIQDYEIQNKPFFPDTKKTYPLTVQIQGQKNTGTLSLNAKFKDKNWHLYKIQLKASGKTIALSPLFVGETNFYAASLSSPRLEKPVFLTGEDIYFEIFLDGISKSQNPVYITESLAILDQNKNLITQKANIARYQKSDQDPHKQVIRFTNKFGDLKPGQYTIQMQFRDHTQKLLESYSQDIVVKAKSGGLYVKSVEYFEDQSLMSKVQPEFKPGDPIFLRLSLDGFRIKNSEISGIVDLKIENSMGELIANRPKFASFKHAHQKDRMVTIDGQFQLKEPDIYLLSFRVRDAQSPQKITHQEKVLVTLK